MKILFVCKGEYRYFFPAIARTLKRRTGYSVTAVTFTTPATRMVQKSGAFDEVHNLAAYLKQSVGKSDLQACMRSLRAFDLSGNFETLNTMVYADRIISRYPLERVIRILAGVCEFWSALLEQAQPDAIFGEVACATEWIAWSLARELNIAYLMPYPTPVANRSFFLGSPSGTWCLMERLFEVVKKKGLSFEEAQIAMEFLQNFRAKKVKPPFLASALRSPLIPDPARLIGRLSRIPFRIQTYLEDGYFEVGSYHGTPPWEPFWEDTVRVLRHVAAEATIFENRIPEGDKVYFPLHMQPEFTTDVRAPFYTSQTAVIEGVAKSVPVGYRVIVKEHPGMKGERPLSYYRELKKLYNVQLLSPSVDSHDLIQQSDVVLTITGSTAWEALLYAKPVVAFGPLCYGFYDLIYHCANIKDLSAILSEATRRFKPDHDLLLKFVWSLLGSAYEFEWGEPIRSPSVMETSNIDKVAKAIVSEISFRASRQAAESVSAYYREQ